MGDDFTLEDILIIVKRRALFCLLPFLAVFLAAAVAIFLMPAKYTAQGTILVESQQIPSELVRSTINAYAQERIQTIRQRVMTQNRLLEIAGQFDLFSDQRRLSESEIVRKMRNSLSVDLIQVDRRGSTSDGTIAFTVAYRDRSRQKAYLVANEIMTLFLSEDVRTRTAGASNTTEFFEREAARTRDAVTALEQRIADFKSENANALPEHLSMHLEMLSRTRRDLEAMERSTESLQEERQFLESQIVSGAQSENGLAAQIAAKEAELARLRALFSNDYPDVQAVRAEIATMKQQLAPSPTVQRMRRELVRAEEALLALERDGEAAEPEAIAAAETAMSDAREALSEQISRETRNGSGDISSVQMEGRIAIIDNRIRSNARRANDLRGQIVDLQERIAQTPAVERNLATLTREQQNLFTEYQELRAKQQDAQLAENLEQNQQAEKFSILEPASSPESPSEPNRPKLLTLALFVAGAIGGGVALAAELLFATIRGRNHLTKVFDEHPVAIIPYIDNGGGRNFRAPLFARRRAAAPKPA